MKNPVSTAFLCLSAFHLGAAVLLPVAHAEEKPLQVFSIKDDIGHRWNQEIVHFDFDVPTNGPVMLTDQSGKEVPAQFSDLKKNGNSTAGRVWTVVSLDPRAEAVFQLRPGRPGVKSDLRITRAKEEVVLSNEVLAVRLPKWPGTLAEPRNLSEMLPPVAGVRGRDGAWLGGGKWFGDGPGLAVKEAVTTIVEEGPVRAVVLQKIVFADGRSYSARIELGAGQEVALITEESNLEAAAAGWRFSFEPGLKADHVFWHNQWKVADTAGVWQLADTAVQFDKENLVATLRPWTFWWADKGTMWAGFYDSKAGSHGENPFVGVLMLNPSKWLPGGERLQKLEIPITAGPDGRLDMTMSFLAPGKTPDGKETLMRREWGITAGTTAEHVLDPKVAIPLVGKPEGTAKLRRQLIKYGEFPLDEVKDYGFEFQSKNAGKKHPFLVLSPGDVERVRLQAKTNPAVKAHADQAIKYIATCGGADRTLNNEGPAVFYKRHYWGNGLTEMLPEAYLASDDPIYGRMMAAAVQGLSNDIYAGFIEDPVRPSLGSFGPWVTSTFTRLLLTYDLIAGTGLLSAEDDKRAYNALVFGAHFLADPDFWNPEHGLASGNPNMTSMIDLTSGLMGLYLAGHPRADMWAGDAEKELKLELADWITPGGAWLESPGYQGSSLDGMLLLATAIRNVHGRDYFADPNFKSTMDYHGTLLTPPDRRFPPKSTPHKFNPTHYIPEATNPSMLPTTGDLCVGSLTPFNGWMAAATAKTDPEFSKQQQFFWKLQNYQFLAGNRANGLTIALNNAELPAAPPEVLARRFPGFGNVMRTSWTDPKASYLLHRTGGNSHHYHDDMGSFIYYAKGAPLCLDFGNQYSPIRRDEAWWHNRVSFNTADSAKKWGTGGGETVELVTLPGILDYSYGKIKGGGNQEDHRYIFLVQSDDPLGANYVVMRDKTADGQADQQFFWNLFCLAKEPQINGNIVHFPGQMDVDLDATVLAPANPQITTDHWKWERDIPLWKVFGEEFYGVRIAKTGSKEDYFVVLYPRAEGQAPAEVTAIAGGAAARVGHMEGTDLVLLSPGKPVEAADGGMQLKGEMGFVRKNIDGTVLLAIVKGEGTAACDGWGLESEGGAGVTIKGKEVSGESLGTSKDIVITLPTGYGSARATVADQVVPAVQNGNVLTLRVPDGAAKFTVTPFKAGS